MVNEFSVPNFVKLTKMSITSVCDVADVRKKNYEFCENVKFGIIYENLIFCQKLLN